MTSRMRLPLPMRLRLARPPWAGIACFLAVSCGLPRAALYLPAQSAFAADPEPAATESSETKKNAAAGELPQRKPASGKPAETRQPDVANPLVDGLKRLFKSEKGAGGNPNDAAPASADSRRRSTPVRRNAMDARAPSDNQVDDWLARASALASAGEWKTALEVLQRVSALPEDALFFAGDRGWVSALWEANRLRGQAPAEILREYRQQFGGLARQLLAQAVDRGDALLLGRVANTYFHTEAGYEAANRIAARHLDRGELVSAARWLSELWKARAPLTGNLVWRAKTAWVLETLGDHDAAHDVAPAAGQAVVVGGARHDFSGSISSGDSSHGSADPVLSEWMTFYGTVQRRGVASGGQPLLLPRWRHELTDNLRSRSQLEQLSEDLGDLGQSTAPALFATAVGGKIAFRTLHGVAVLDADTGRTAWVTAARQPIDKLLAGSTADVDNAGLELGLPGFARGGIAPRGNVNFWNIGMQGHYRGAGENSPLCNLLLRNANFGLLGSDGERLFVIDDAAFLTHRQPGNQGPWDANQFDRVAAGNRLVAYDLDSGRPVWSAGGTALGEAFDPPLAGYHFFGPPVADGGELFAVAEATSGNRSDQIRLVVLDAQTGALRWSQLIAHASAAIDKDVGRRWWPAQVAIDAGVVVCPTTAGWLTAVDRVSRTLLWGYRAPAAGLEKLRPFDHEQHGGAAAAALVQPAPLSGRWWAAPPILVDGRVVYAPLESNTLVCLELATGKEVWTKPRGSGLFLAGVFAGCALVVEREAVVAYNLADGSPAWRTKIPVPSGRGVALADRYTIPLMTGEIWSLALSDGSVIETMYAPSDRGALGNLLMYRRKLLSLDLFGLTAFEQRQAIHDEIAERLRDGRHAAETTVQEAEVHVADRNYPAAVSLLAKLPVAGLSLEVREKRRRLLVEALHAVIAADFSRPQAADDLAQLASLVDTPEEVRRVKQLRARLLVAGGDLSAAFDVYLELAGETSAVLLARDDQPETQVKVSAWVAGAIADLLEEAPAELRRQVDRRIAAQAAAARQQNAQAQYDFLALFANHPAANAVRSLLAETLARQGEFLEAERLLLEMQKRGDMASAAEAVERLARLMRQFDLPADAAGYYALLEERYGDVELAPGKSARRHVAELRAAGRLPQETRAIADWQASAFRIERLGAMHASPLTQVLHPKGATAAFFQQVRLEIDPAAQRLEVCSAASDEMLWSLPLRCQAASPDASLAFCYAAAHQLTVLHRGMIHCLSPVERRVLWTRPADGRQTVQPYYGRNTTAQQPMQPASALANRLSSQSAMSSPVDLAAVSEQFVCCQGRHELSLLDARTGGVRWTWAGIRPGMQIFAGRDVIYIRPRGGKNPVALRAADGKRLDVSGLADMLDRAIGQVGNALVLPEARGGFRLHDPLTGNDLWARQFDRKALVSPLEGGRLAVLERDEQAGALHVLDFETGNSTLLGALTPDELRERPEAYVLADGLNVYLLLNRKRGNRGFSEIIPFVPADGLLLAFDPQRAKLRWKQPVASQNLMIERLESSPLLIFGARNQSRRRNDNVQYLMLHLLAIDKLSGARLFDETCPVQPSLRTLTVNAAERYIELRGFSERLRLRPVEKSAVEGTVGD